MTVEATSPHTLSTANGLAAIEAWLPEWRALQQAAPAPIACDPDWVGLAWTHVAARERGAELLILSARDAAGDLVLIWPLYRVREGGTVRIRHLGSGSKEEYAGPLLKDGAPAGHLLASALAELGRHGDVLEVYNLPQSAPWLAGLTRERACWTGATRSPIISTSGFASGEEWRRGKSANFRQQIRAKRKRLEKLGTVRSGVTSPEDIAAFVDWTFDQKAGWVQEHAIADSWIERPASRAFFKAAMADMPERVIGIDVRLDGKRVASVILFLADHSEFFVTTYDPEFSAYSPGLLVLDAVVDHACEHELDVDLRLTTDSYKLRWADRFEDRRTLFIALTGSGRRAVLATNVTQRVRQVRKRAAALIRKMRPRARS